MKKSLGAPILALPAPVWVVGSYGEDKNPNIMTIAWGGICCSAPPCVTISLQKHRLTYNNILKNKAFTINIPSQQQVIEADYVGIISGKDEDKFAITGLTPIASQSVNAPYIQEFPLILECRLLQTVELGVHTQFIGEIIDVLAEEKILGENGLPLLAKINPPIYSPSERAYYEVGEYVGKSHSIGLALRKEQV